MQSYFFFFSIRRRHTISYGDWSSDVCSSDLVWWHLHAAVGPQRHPAIDVARVEAGRVATPNVIDRSSDSLLVPRLLPGARSVEGQRRCENPKRNIASRAPGHSDSPIQNTLEVS